MSIDERRIRNEAPRRDRRRAAIQARRLLSHAASLVVIARRLRLPPRALRLLFARSLAEPLLVERRREPMRFLVRSRLELLVLKEVALDREYERFGGPVESGWTVLDIGAGPGEFAVDVALRHPACAIHAFEPSPAAYDLLRRNLALNGVESVVPHACAVGAIDGWSALDARSPYSSLHRLVSADDGATEASTRVETRTLDSVVRDLRIERIDFLKIDCEGSELDILGCASAECLATVQRICAEVHDVSDRGAGALPDLLSAAGFSVRFLPGPPWTDTGWLWARRAG